MDFEYDGADDLGGNILWGRVIVLGVAVLFFFLFGRCTAGGGADPADVSALESEVATAVTTRADLESTIASLQQEIVTLRDQIANASGTVGIDGTTTTPSEGATPVDPAAPAPGTAGQVYVVQAGDTLSDIAEAVYGDPLAFGVIATANGITESNPLQVGQELTIPANPDG